MVDFVLDEIVAVAEMLAVDAMLITELLLEEAEVTAEFLMGAVASMMRVLDDGGDNRVFGAAVAERFERL
jgi:hypothetical protein